MPQSLAPRMCAVGVLVTALAGCSRAEAPESPPAASASSAAPSDTAIVDPCALVTQAEADDVLGATSTQDRPSEANHPPVLVTCRYTAPRGAGLAVLTVAVRTGYSDTEARTGFQGTRELGSTEPVAGLGDDALWLADQLHVLAGRRLLVLSGDVDRAVAQRLGQQALDRMR